MKLRPGENIEYVDAGAKLPNRRVRAYSLWEGWHGYDKAKYAAMLREAFEPFEHPCRVTQSVCAYGEVRKEEVSPY